MIWFFLVISLGLATARRHVDPEYLDQLRAEGKDEEFAELLGIDVKLTRPRNEGRSEGSRMNMVSALGDILLTPDQEEHVRQGIDFEKYEESRWDNDEIPFLILKRDYTKEQIQIILDAVADFNSKVDNVQLVPYANDEDFVLVFSGDGCYSAMGRNGGQQGLSLQNDGCVDQGTVQHEFMHAAGLAHEHNRPDRDKYIKMLWKNIPSKWKSQYDKVDPEEYGIQGPYDYYSIMHYEVIAPDTDDLPAFEVLEDGIDEDLIGKGKSLTDIDIDKLNEMYS